MQSQSSSILSLVAILLFFQTSHSATSPKVITYKIPPQASQCIFTPIITNDSTRLDVTLVVTSGKNLNVKLKVDGPIAKLEASPKELWEASKNTKGGYPLVINSVVDSTDLLLGNEEELRIEDLARKDSKKKGNKFNIPMKGKKNNVFSRNKDKFGKKEKRGKREEMNNDEQGRRLTDGEEEEVDVQQQEKDREEEGGGGGGEEKLAKNLPNLQNLNIKLGGLNMNNNGETGEVQHRLKKEANPPNIREPTKDGKFTLPLTESGYYRTCVVNDVSSWTTKLIDLTIDIVNEGTSPDSGNIPALERMRKVEDMAIIDGEEEDKKNGVLLQQLKTLTAQVEKVRSGYHLESERLQAHRETNSSSHSTIVLAGLIETLVFVIVCCCQVYGIKRWFDQKNGILGGGSSWGGNGCGGGSRQRGYY